MSNDVKLVMSSILRVQPTLTHCSHGKQMVCIPCLTPGRQSATSRKRRSSWRRNRRNDLLRVVHLGVFESTILSWQPAAIVENQWHLMGIVLPERNPNSKNLGCPALAAYFPTWVWLLKWTVDNRIGFTWFYWLHAHLIVYILSYLSQLCYPETGLSAAMRHWWHVWGKRDISLCCLLLELVGCATTIHWMADQPWNLIGWVISQMIIHVLPEGMVS